MSKIIYNTTAISEFLGLPPVSDIEIEMPDFPIYAARYGDDLLAMAKLAWEANRGKKRTPEQRKRMSEGQKKSKNHATRGKKRPEFAANQTGEKNAMYGTISPMRGKKHKVVICPHCEKKGGGGAMKRFHFDNCKEI